MALIPLKDDTKIKDISFQYVTVSIIVMCTSVFLWQLSLGDQEFKFAFGLGAIPSVLTGSKDLHPDLVIIPAWATTLTSLFLHGGWMHLIFNMLFLWVFGDNIEDSMGHVRFIVFYLLCGVIATLIYVVMSVDSEVPLVGASGAISGILGAYLVLHPKARLLVLFMHIIPLRLPAIVVLLGWIGFQFLSLGSESNTAWWAHIGGFFAGMVLVAPFRRKEVPLLDGLQAGPNPDINIIQLQEKRHRRSIFPNTVQILPVERPGTPPTQPFQPRGPWVK